MKPAIAICCLASACIVGAIATAQEIDDQPTRSKPRVADLLPAPDWGENLSGPLCGVYSACTAAELIGLEADPRNFIAIQYVGQCGGSSPEEVAHVVEDAGARARILSRLSAFDLRLIDCPLIANVRISPASNRFNHWVVAVPGDGEVMIFDGLQKPYDISTAEFLGSWSGIGICVTQNESNPLAIIWLGRISLLLVAVLLTILVLRSRRLLSRASKAGAVKQFCGLCAASLILGVAGNAVFGDLLNHGKGVAVATAPSQDGNYRIGTLEDAEKASASGNMLLIDARREQDYRLGTIDGAVNIPVTASTWEINKYLETLDRNTPIVVFCQSAFCPYDETVGTQLVSLGFRNVLVCNEGWSEYEKSMPVASNQ